MEDFISVSLEGSEGLNSPPAIDADCPQAIHSADKDETQSPNMWSLQYIGLYSQYAAVGLLYGTSGTIKIFCPYVYHGEPNVCANAVNIMFFAWSFKIVYGVITDCIHPFGSRRRIWMLFGWTGVLALLLVLGISPSMNVSTWLYVLLGNQCFMMFSDVVADGYSVELGKLESKKDRGKILSTGQMVRFGFTFLAGFIQTVFLNDQSTNAPGCPISQSNDINSCWSWGLNAQQYYLVIFAITVPLIIPVFFLKEIKLECKSKRDRSLKHILSEVWLILQDQTTFYLMIFASGITILSGFTVTTDYYLQYYIIKLTNIQSGIDTISTFCTLTLAIWLFQKFLRPLNWRYTQYMATIFSSLCQLLYILAYHNTGGLRNAWFTIFIDLDVQFLAGLSQVSVRKHVLYCS